MQRVSRSALSVSTLARRQLMRPAATQTFAPRYMSTGGSFEKKGHADEEIYFKKIAEEKKIKLHDNILKEEVSALLTILPENHGLSPDVIHDILDWKHNA